MATIRLELCVGRTVAQGVVPLCGLQAQQLVALLNFERAQRLAVDGLDPAGASVGSVMP